MQRGWKHLGTLLLILVSCALGAASIWLARWFSIALGHPRTANPRWTIRLAQRSGARCSDRGADRRVADPSGRIGPDVASRVESKRRYPIVQGHGVAGPALEQSLTEGWGTASRQNAYGSVKGANDHDDVTCHRDSPRCRGE